MAIFDLTHLATRPSLSSVYVSSLNATVDVSVPIVALESQLNDWNVAAQIPVVTIAIDAVSSTSFDSDLSVGGVYSRGTIVSSTIYDVSATIKSPIIDVVGSSEKFATVSINIPSITSSISLIQDGIYNLTQSTLKPSLSSYAVLVGSPSKYTISFTPFNLAHTVYSNYNFNSYFNIGTRFFGVTSTGVYEITGKTDNAAEIASEVTLPISMFDTQEKKSCSDAILYMRADGDVEVVAIVNEQEQREGFIINFDDKEGLHRRRVKIPKGLNGTTWGFKIRSVSGSSFGVNNFEAFLSKLQRIE